MMSTKQKEALGPLFNIANNIRLAYLRMKYAGDKVYCACCGSKFREFAPFSHWKKPNSWCPKCQSLERHRLLWMYLENKTDFYKKPVKLLHIAPEKVFFDHFKHTANIDYHPVDIMPHLYPQGTNYFDLVHPNLDFEQFDVVICNHVFAYIDDDATAIKNVYRLMKPGGWAILMVALDKSKAVTLEDKSVTDQHEREKVFGLKEHVRYYGMDYADKLRAAGFDVLVDDYSAEFSDADNFKYGFWKGDAVYFCRKPVA